MATTYQPMTDEAPLESNPYKWNPNRSGDSNSANWKAFNDFASMFGRNPTKSELAMLSPSYSLNDPNLLNVSGGSAAIASYYNQLAQSPLNLAKKQTSDLQTQAPQHYDSVNQLFKSNLGRDATDAEKTHFGMLLASGQDPYEIQQALQSTTEYQGRATEDYTKRLGNQLQATNADYFSKYIAPDLQSKAAQSGRSFDSSGVNAQLANAAQGQNYELQNYLAQVSANQYGASTSVDQNRYNQLYANQGNLSNSNISNALSNSNYMTQRNNALSDYAMQQQAYSSYLDKYGKRDWMDYANLGLGALNTGANVAKTFAAF